MPRVRKFSYLANGLGCLYLVILCAVCRPDLKAAEGPGFPNIDYSPALQGTMLLTNNTGKAVSGVSMHRGYLIVPMGADHGGGMGAGAIAAYDIGTVSSPVKVFDSRDFSSVYHVSTGTNYVGNFAEAHHISISGNFLFCSERSATGGGFSILDVSNLYDNDTNTRPVIVGRYAYPNGSAPSNYDVYSFAPAWQGSRYVFAPVGSGGLHIIETTNFNSAVLIKHLNRSELGNLTLRSAVAIGNLLILSSAAVEPTFNALILDISDPANPQQIGSFGGALGYQGFVFGSSFYGGGKPLQRHNFSNPQNVITTTLASGAALDLLDRPEYGFGQDNYLFIGHYPGATKWAVTNNTATFVGRNDSGLVDDHAFPIPLGNLVAITSDHANPQKLMIGIHDYRKDDRPPVVNFTSPANGATNVHVKSRIGLCFTDYISPYSLNTNTLILRIIGSNTPLAGTYSAMEGIVNFVPSSFLETNRSYEVVLAANGVRDFAGNASTNQTVVLQFSTGATVETYSTKVVTDVPSVTGSTVNLSIDVKNLSGFPLEHAWVFDDGTPMTSFSGGTNISHTYIGPGNYVVTVHTRIVGQTTDSMATGVQVIHRLIPAASPVHSSTIVYDSSNLRVWNVNPDNGTVTALHATNYTKISETPVGQNPKSLALGPGNSLWVVNKKSATISVINRATGAVIQTYSLPTASAPHGIVVNVAAQRAYVSLEGFRQVVELDTTTGNILRTVNTGPWPRGLALDPIEGTLWVARFISPDDAGKITAIDLATFSVANVASLDLVTDPDTLTSGGGLPNYLGALAISPDYSQLFVPAKKDNIFRGVLRNGQQLTFEHTVRSMASSIDLASRTEIPSRRLDLDNSDFATCVAYSPLGNQVFFAANGSATIWVVDAYSSSAQDAFTFGAGGMAPDGMAVSTDGKRLFVHNFMSRTVTVFGTTVVCASVCGTAPQIATVNTVASEKLSPQVLRGKQIFYDSEDTRLSSDSYMSCASCHLDAGHDGRVWDFTGAGEGLRNTIDLNGRGVGHGPVHWTANFDEVQDFEGQIRALGGGTGLMSDDDFHSGSVSQPLGQSKAGFSSDLDALAAYVGSLTNAGVSPYRLSNGSLTPLAVLGREIFRTQNCAQCHSGTAFTDSASLARHNVGTLLPSSGKRLGGELDGLDAPTLRGLWSTAPYLHDGSAPTLRDVLVTKNVGGLHGNLFSLSESQIGQLVSYLQQIDDLETIAPSSGTNTPPLLVNPGNQFSERFQSVTLNLIASDPDGDSWTFHALGLPPGLVLDSITGIISGAPTTAALYTVHLSARDSAGNSAEHTVLWEVHEPFTSLADMNPDFSPRRYIKLAADSSIAGDVWTSIAEFYLYGTNGSLLDRSGWIAMADSEETNGEFAPASNAIDGTNTTFWHTSWSGVVDPPHPHTLTIDLGVAQAVGGFAVLPRQDSVNGRIKDWRFFWSNDGTNWTGPIARGAFANSTALQRAWVPGLTGFVTREFWTNISGTTVQSLTSVPNYPGSPDGFTLPALFEGPATFGNNYGTRVHGYVIPPVSGNYTFWIASDDNGELWLGANHDPATAQLIASVPQWTDFRQWTKFASQQSAPIYLEAGVAYYIRALQKEGTGGDNLSVAWEGPANPGTNVISGQYLMPFSALPLNQPPVFTNPAPIFFALENSPAGATVGTVVAADPELETVLYSITGGNVGGAFAINSNTGVLTVQGVLDYETRSRYDLTVLARESGSEAAGASAIVTVFVSNVLENNGETVKEWLTQPGGAFPGHANPALIGFDRDPDSDGWVNALEVLFGTDPAVADQPSRVRFVPEFAGGKKWMNYEFDVNAFTADFIRFHCYGSSNMFNWSELTNSPQSIFEAGEVRTYRVRDDTAANEANLRTMRIGVSPSD